MALQAALQRFIDRVKARLTLPYNTQHHLVMTENGQLTTRPAVLPLSLVADAAAAEIQKGVSEDFSAVFANWLRISRTAGNTSDVVNPAELDAWVYDADTDRIRCTKNTGSVVGFISPDRYDDYVFETILRSSSADDDPIGLCIAYARDHQGQTHVLSAFRSMNGNYPLHIGKNGQGMNDSGYLVAGVLNGLTWANGTVATGPIGGSTHGGWNLIPDGVRLKVTRQGDLITVETSQPNESTYFAPATTTFSLTDHPELEVFRGPQRFGYLCHSQPDSTWEVLQRPGTRTPIYDRANGVLWTFQNNQWVSAVQTPAQLAAAGHLVPNWLHYNPATQAFFFVEPNLTIREI